MAPDPAIDRFPVLGHLEELRSRLIRSFIVVLAAFVIAYMFSGTIVSVLFYPIKNALPPGSTMVYTNLTEGFMTYLKVALWTAVVVSAPFLVHQIWAFVAPGLYSEEKRVARRFLMWFSGLFFAGGAFGYWVVMPVVLSISLGFAGADLEPMPRLQNCLLFALKTIFTFGLIFEIPFAMGFVVRSGLVADDYFRRNRKTSYIALFILAVVVTPTDIFTQILLFLPFVGMYEAGILLGRLFAGRTSSVVGSPEP